MRVLYLNCWHGGIEKKLLTYIKNMSQEVDAFCLQEVPPSLQNNIEKILIGYKPFHYCIPAKLKSVNFFGQSIFIRKGITTVNYKITEIFQNRKPNYGFLQTVDIFYKGVNISLAKIHGRSQPGHKLDTRSRIIQSRAIVDALINKKGLKVVGGDFNLEPNTKSIKILEKSGLLNLIDVCGIKTTRNNLAWKESKSNGKKGILKYYKKQLFADYCFVGENVRVKSFEVPNIEISDHLPLILEFEV